MMRHLYSLHIWALLFIGSRTTATVPMQELLNTTWPAAHHSWVAGFPDTEPSRVQFTVDSKYGTFCRGKTHPPDEDRVPFPAEGGRLEFATKEAGGSTGDGDSDWSVNVSFDEWHALGWNGLQTVQPPVVTRVNRNWRWDEGRRSNDSVCSAGLRIVDEIQSAVNAHHRAYRVPRTRLLGTQATLAIEIVRRPHRRHGASARARASSESNVASVLRQCTYIRFVDESDVKDSGPCGISMPSHVLSPIQSIFERGDGTRTTGYAVWVTLVIVLGVVSLLSLAICLFQKRSRDRRKMKGPDGTIHDVRTARLAQTQKIVAAPGYATAAMKNATDDGSLLSYEVATEK
ncbi:hypothetical protein E4U54_001024 [Claviceps lovelessii]|nr:hypothetical protein E4U54_001024 [Claviceps lovelessii]